MSPIKTRRLLLNTPLSKHQEHKTTTRSFCRSFVAIVVDGDSGGDDIACYIALCYIIFFVQLSI